MQDFCKNNRALVAKKYAGLFLPKVGWSHHFFISPMNTGY